MSKAQEGRQTAPAPAPAAANGADDAANNNNGQLKSPTPTLLERLGYVSRIYSLKNFIAPFVWYRDWMEWFYPPDGAPNIVKAYECRPHLPVRIFFPASHDLTSPTPLPTLITLHGGGFCIGSARDADEWSRAFSDAHSTLVISLSYSLAPRSPFPGALHDLEALYAAVIADESLPIARAGNTSGGSDGVSRVAVLGFSAGGNLAVALSTLPSVRGSPDAPKAVLSVYGCLDLSIAPETKAKSRFYKTKLVRPRGDPVDFLVGIAPTFDWSYIPYGHDLRDPLLSPAYASEEHLPPFVCVIAAELDMLAHESWRFAVRVGNERFPGSPGCPRHLPDIESPNEEMRRVGRKAPSRRRGKLAEEEGGDERFGWEEYDEGRGVGVKWMLVPDVLHGFDSPDMRRMMANEDAIRDAEGKAKAEIEAVGRWLRGKVWRL